MDYKATKVRNADGREQWAVLHMPTRVFYYAPAYGKRGAERYAAYLNKIDEEVKNEMKDKDSNEEMPPLVDAPWAEYVEGVLMEQFPDENIQTKEFSMESLGLLLARAYMQATADYNEKLHAKLHGKRNT